MFNIFQKKIKGSEATVSKTEASLNFSGKYDDASWHHGGDFPKDLPDEQAYVHAGMFLGWIIDNDLYNKEFLINDFGMQKEIDAFKDRKLSGPKLFESLDGKLTDEDLSEEGNKFAKAYYVGDAYYKDYGQILGGELPSFYYIQDTWENYDKLKVRLDQRFAEWKKQSI